MKSKSPYRMSVLTLEHKLEAAKPDLLVVCGPHKAVIDVFVFEGNKEVFLVIDDIDSKDAITTGTIVDKLKTIESNYNVSLAEKNPDGEIELCKICDLAQNIMLLEGTDKNNESVIRVGLMKMPMEV